MNRAWAFWIALAVVTAVLPWACAGCSREAVVKNSVDAARALCCYMRIREGESSDAAEAACNAADVVAPYVELVERMPPIDSDVSADAGSQYVVK